MTALTEAPRHVARWTAIGCTVHVETRRADELSRARGLVEQILTDVDEVASRFREDSDLSRVNRRPGSWVRVDPLLVAAVRVAVEAAEASDGIVHPLLGRPLVELGYDRTINQVREVDRPARPQTPPPAIDSWRDIELSEDGVRIPGGTSLDLGATGKAWCTDLAVAALEESLDDDAVVSVGGDLRTAGSGSWQVAVAERPTDAPAVLVTLTGALATSSTQVRRWRRNGVERHHLLDPRTGAPAPERWRTATVAAATCVAANTASTGAIVQGADAVAWLTDLAVPAARLVDRSGQVRTLGAWPAAAHPALPSYGGER
ncbi:FAD:protein FMN transferase [Nocardioides daeguensis]|uniref:FAD:protein FMN transferase n=1 Tax=Nocardioides daeguensis TaxID=908359 RepID=A0ABP6W3T4_9ACTN|nr:FAD:protein FMN transferase [Nocardioides daeguensis]MBV6727665.1 FAD:protein FMN transferase [Nocardioides daeguensis]MCR1775137.1 FAD:protein FMN transferase [Nocardioides daeguensis]